jgi:hypothetical protein
MELEKGSYLLRDLTGFSGIFPVRGRRVTYSLD